MWHAFFSPSRSENNNKMCMSWYKYKHNWKPNSCLKDKDNLIKEIQEKTYGNSCTCLDGHSSQEFQSTCMEILKNLSTIKKATEV